MLTAIIFVMNLERVVERLRDYRLKNERFDRLVGAVLSNETAMRAARATVAAARSVSRRGQTVASGDYDTVFFVAGEMRSGTSWLRHSLSDHPEIACGQEGSFFGRGYDSEEIPVYTGPVSSLTRALAVSRELKTWHALPWNLWSDGYDEDLRNLCRLSVDYFLSKEVARTGRRIVGDKSPQHTENLDEIYEIYPDARIIHIVRDGRDVAVSAMHHWWRLARDREGGVFELTPEELRIRDDYAEDRERFLSEGRSIFTQERLVQLARRWEYRTGKGSDDGVLERCLRSSSFERASSRRQGEEDSASFFRKGVAGDWRDVFTERDRELYKDLAGERLVEFGYEKSYDW